MTNGQNMCGHGWNLVKNLINFGFSKCWRVDVLSMIIGLQSFILTWKRVEWFSLASLTTSSSTPSYVPLVMQLHAQEFSGGPHQSVQLYIILCPYIYIYIWAVKIRCISVVAIIGCSFWEGHIAFQCFVPLSLLRGTISLYSVSRTTLTKYSCNWY